MHTDPFGLVAALERIKTLHPVTIDLSLDRIKRLLADLGSPHLRVPPVIHVAGTNGKGSVVAMMRAVLEASDYRVHVYTSPHLVSFTERIRLCGSLIDPVLLTDLISHTEQVNGDAPITFFEMVTAVAYQAFAQVPADVLLLETGLGGRLDATNVVPRPCATVLTSISMDHMSYLGNSLSAIAGEKAAIMKSGTPCISAAQSPDVESVINKIATERDITVAWQGVDWTVEESPFGTVRYADVNTEWIAPRPALPGPHQIGNVGLALATLARGPFAIPALGIRAGMRDVEWPARLQKLNEGPLVKGLPEMWDLWLDGGHNPSAGAALASWLVEEPSSTIAICGMMAGKDNQGFLKPLMSHISTLITVPIPGHDGSMSANDLAACARDTGFSDVIPSKGLDDALAVAQTKVLVQRGRLLVCGSLYLAGEILKTHR